MRIQKLILITSLITLSTALVAEPKGHGKRMFDRVDSDGDGYVSFEEFKVPPRERRRKADLDGDGEVTREEVSQHIAERNDEMTERANQHFAKMDLNGDDVVTREEAKQAAFYRMDEDQDGVLSPAELKRPNRKHHGKKHAKSDGN
jgi:Ca2+-binding EF-hand superfamily protein